MRALSAKLDVLQASGCTRSRHQCCRIDSYYSKYDNYRSDVVLEKHWDSMTGRAVVDTFWEVMNACPRRDEVPPVLVAGKNYIVSILRNDCFYVAVLSGDAPPLLVIELLHRIVDVYELYFGSHTSRVLMNNFAVAYQLLHEMVALGYTMLTEPNALVTLVSPPSVLSRFTTFVTGQRTTFGDKLGAGATSIIPWRRSDVKYTANEIFFDLREEVDAIVEANGVVTHTDIRGTLHCNCKMSGFPDLTLLFSDPGLIEDASFHPCVRLGKFETDRCLSFVPPDGPFRLMQYRCAQRGPFHAPVSVRPDVQWHGHEAKVRFELGARPTAVRGGGVSSRSASSSGGTGVVAGSGKPSAPVAEDVGLLIFFPKAVISVNLKPTHGKASYDPKANTVTWIVGAFPPGTTPRLEGTATCEEGAETPIERIHSLLRFVMGSGTASGLGVRDVLLSSESYRFFKGVKAFMRTGRFQIRA